MIDIKNVSKCIDDKYILSNINLHVNKGSIFGIIGENGAGKTTLIKCLTGIYKVNEGSILIDGEEIFDNNIIKQRIGYVSDENQYFSSFKVKELLKFYKKTYNDFSEERFDELNKKFKIPVERRIRELSKGMKMRIAILLNLSIKPDILILDEPTSGLDPVIKKEIMSIIVDEVASRGVTVFISSHHLDHIERICDNVAIIKNGEIKHMSSIDDAKNSIKKLQVVFKSTVDGKEDLSSLNDVIKVETIGRVNYIITKNHSKDFEKRLYDMGADFIEIIDMSLEDMFIYFVEEEDKNE
ncbi:ABC transporter ATP-binding protein [Clostridium tagluense]|uniref:ABC transporter ATP-binding protein n=1 Tax=Clostridium tagluense TaxID=360422 RepID=UPI001CF37027|nr:ABC transporter ATP-binding protein [Clostridium tagluense]MCB2313418.1 ABC transporter ATP-binding protein [Clostridium tagluense]MCB2318228.1 ABC transporter ATP-binding protein [Clostridium tagluense]MCB2323030.1 ABC transporter ATP-binding protein [Clostridium tagluense]MCB2328026.1 ABC transporter ATP-binding protein [Clostridium tagluense]MCB2332745.1 ABC transporter ATP-binding protein [Clostridium tagluense]